MQHRHGAVLWPTSRDIDKPAKTQQLQPGDQQSVRQCTFRQDLEGERRTMKLQPYVRSTMLRHMGHCCQFSLFASFSSSASIETRTQFTAEDPGRHVRSGKTVAGAPFTRSRNEHTYFNRQHPLACSRFARYVRSLAKCSQEGMVLHILFCGRPASLARWAPAAAAAQSAPRCGCFPHSPHSFLHSWHIAAGRSRTLVNAVAMIIQSAPYSVRAVTA